MQFAWFFFQDFQILFPPGQFKKKNMKKAFAKKKRKNSGEVLDWF